MKMKLLTMAAAVAALALAFAACPTDGGGGGGGTTGGDIVAVTNIAGVQTYVKVDTPLALTGTVEPANATNKTIVWSVKDAGTTGASISGSTLTVTATGTVVVTATIANGLTATMPFVKDFTISAVTEIPYIAVTSISGVPDRATIGTDLPLTGTVNPGDATNKTIVWSVKTAGTTGASIVDGKLKTTAAGTVIVTATITGGATATTPYTQDFAIVVSSGIGYEVYAWCESDESLTVRANYIDFLFPEGITGLTINDITITNGTGIVAKKTLTTRDNRSWRLEVTVTKLGTATVSVTKSGIDSAAKTVEFGIDYRATANGDANTTSTRIDFVFADTVTGLTAGDIDIDAWYVTKGALTGSGKNWSLAIANVTAGAATVSINKSGIDSAAKNITLYKSGGGGSTITYTATADGSESATSTRIDFEFSADLTGLTAGDITLGGTPGVAGKGELTGSGRNWSLAISTVVAGAATVSINKSGIESAAKNITLYKSGGSSGGTTYTAEQMGNYILFTFSGNVTGLTANDIAITSGTGAAAKGSVSSITSTMWMLGITIQTYGTVYITINKTGIDNTPHPVTLQSGPAWPENLDNTTWTWQSGGGNNFNGTAWDNDTRSYLTFYNKSDGAYFAYQKVSQGGGRERGSTMPLRSAVNNGKLTLGGSDNTICDSYTITGSPGSRTLALTGGKMEGASTVYYDGTTWTEVAFVQPAD